MPADCNLARSRAGLRRGRLQPRGIHGRAVQGVDEVGEAVHVRASGCPLHGHFYGRFLGEHVRGWRSRGGLAGGCVVLVGGLHAVLFPSARAMLKSLPS